MTPESDGIEIPRYTIPDYTDCFEELRLGLPWGGTLEKDEKRG